MTYHAPHALGGLGETGTFKQFGRANVTFSVAGVSAAKAPSVPEKIRAVIARIPGVLRVTSCAWQAGGTIKATFTMAEGSPVTGTFTAIRVAAKSLGPSIQTGARIFVPMGAARYQNADIVRTGAAAASPAAPESAAPAEAAAPEPAEPAEPAASEPAAPAEASSSGGIFGMPVWAAALGGVAILGVGAALLMRKKPQTATAS
jgi:hypothetical protein